MNLRDIGWILVPLLIGLLIYMSAPLFEGGSYIRNFLPDGLWAFSFTYALFLLWRKNINALVRVLPLILFLAFELAQRLGIITGTFDLIDVLVYFLFYLLASIIFRYEKK